MQAVYRNLVNTQPSSRAPMRRVGDAEEMRQLSTETSSLPAAAYLHIMTGLYFDRVELAAAIQTGSFR